MNLILIGNGFDLAHDYKTKYSDFREWIETHSYYVGERKLSTYFECFSTDEWGDFEDSLGTHVYYEDYYYDKISCLEDDKDIQRAIASNESRAEESRGRISDAEQNLMSTLCNAMEDFIKDKTSENKPPKYSPVIKRRNLYISFNYSRTLEESYKIKPNRILYIHGVINGSTPLMIGHNTSISPYISPEDLYAEDSTNPYHEMERMPSFLEKGFNLNGLQSIRKIHKCSRLIIIGMSLSASDEKYLTMLQNLLPSSIPVEYWLYTQKERKEKESKLAEVFCGHPISVIPYPDSKG